MQNLSMHASNLSFSIFALSLCILIFTFYILVGFDNKKTARNERFFLRVVLDV